MHNEPTLIDKVALVVGGSRGIGAAIVRRLAANGASVALTYANSAEKAAEAENHVADCGCAMRWWWDNLRWPLRCWCAPG